MIDKRMGDRSLQIEVSCGNAGNTIDGQLVSATKSGGQDSDSVASANLDDGEWFKKAFLRPFKAYGFFGLSQ